LGISSYGVGVTTLEEVFLKVANDAEEDENKTESSPIKFTSGEFGIN
jgi:hypothetical protein